MAAPHDQDAPGAGLPTPPVPEREAERLAALHRYRILDTPEEEPFNRLAMLARDLFDTPIALVSFIDESRQWFKARVGVAVQQTPRSWAFCAHTIESRDDVPFVVPDASRDPRFAANPLVLGAPHIRFYAAVPMRSPDGHALGTVCVISDQPRPDGLTAAEARWLTALAGLAGDELELRLQARRAHEAATAEARLRRAQEAAGVVAFEASSTASGRTEVLVAALRRLFGLDAARPFAMQGQTALADEREQARLTAASCRLAAAGGAFREEFRARLADGTLVWAEARGEVRHGVEDDPEGWQVSGLLRDITERRAAEERQALMTRELDHRAKNALAVVLAALRLTPSEDPKAYATAVEGRVAALAHSLTLLAERGWAGAHLGDLVRAELKPFLTADSRAPGPRAIVSGPDVLVTTAAAQPLSMAIHELATNAVKHGALSVARGRLSVTWTREPDGSLCLRWVEEGGPPVPNAPARRGFGSRVIRGTVDQLGGRLSCSWPPSGLACCLHLPEGRWQAGEVPANDRDTPRPHAAPE
jgi:two-component sensor histidine kinase/GAF domain-containing protein